MKTYIVDSFTNVPFKGNPAGVCLLKDHIPETLMLSIARELGLSETAFLMPLSGSKRYSIRYFSPKMEIPLCGHATLASAKVILSETAAKQVEFVTIENLTLIVAASAEFLVMEFPVYETSLAVAPPALLQALGLKEAINCVYNAETNILLLEIDNYHTLANLTPDFAALKASHDRINGVLVTAPSDNDEYDFYSRYFWPWSGTNEDPVTGGTHTFLAKYWGERLGKTVMRSFQCSERSGFMEVSLVAEDKLLIKGQAVIVFQGEFVARTTNE